MGTTHSRIVFRAPAGFSSVCTFLKRGLDYYLTLIILLKLFVI